MPGGYGTSALPEDSFADTADGPGVPGFAGGSVGDAPARHRFSAGNRTAVPRVARSGVFAGTNGPVGVRRPDRGGRIVG